VVGEIVEPDDPEHPIKIQRAHGENVPLQPGGFDHFDGPSATAPPA
jgi:thiamine-monophosphate kinase